MERTLRTVRHRHFSFQLVPCNSCLVFLFVSFFRVIRFIRRIRIHAGLIQNGEGLVSCAVIHPASSKYGLA